MIEFYITLFVSSVAVGLSIVLLFVTLRPKKQKEPEKTPVLPPPPQKFRLRDTHAPEPTDYSPEQNTQLFPTPATIDKMQTLKTLSTDLAKEDIIRQAVVSKILQSIKHATVATQIKATQTEKGITITALKAAITSTETPNTDPEPTPNENSPESPTAPDFTHIPKLRRRATS